MGQRWPDSQKAVGPTSAANVGPTDVPTLGQRRSDGGMLSGLLLSCCALESTTQWRLSTIKVKLELELSIGVYDVRICNSDEIDFLIEHI